MLDGIKREVLELESARTDAAMRSWLTEKLNLLNSLQNLLTYPEIQKAVSEKRLEIHAWYYIIETGEIYEYSMEEKHFVLISHKEKWWKNLF